MWHIVVCSHCILLWSQRQQILISIPIRPKIVLTPRSPRSRPTAALGISDLGNPRKKQLLSLKKNRLRPVQVWLVRRGHLNSERKNPQLQWAKLNSLNLWTMRTRCKSTKNSRNKRSKRGKPRARDEEIGENKHRMEASVRPSRSLLVRKRRLLDAPTLTRSTTRRGCATTATIFTGVSRWPTNVLTPTEWTTPRECARIATLALTIQISASRATRVEPHFRNIRNVFFIT